MFNYFSSMFTGLASKAKSKIIETTLQPLIDYHLENIFEQKIAVQHLNKGIQDVKLNSKHLNTILKINSIKTVFIKFVKLEKLSLEMRDVELVLDLNTYIQEEEVIESLEIEDILQKSVNIQMEQLRKEFLNKEDFLESEILQSDQPKDFKTSSSTVRVLRIVDSIFGNIKLNINNLTIKFIAKKKNINNPISLSINFDQIGTQMQKPQNSNQLFLVGNINSIKIFINDTHKIAQMNNAVQLELYIKSDIEPKIKLHFDILQLNINMIQLDDVACLIFQGFQVMEERKNTIIEAVRKSNTQAFLKSNQRKQCITSSNQINLKKYIQPNFYEQNKGQNQLVQTSILESIINVEYQNNTKIADFNKSVKHMFEQKEFLFLDWEGLNLNIVEEQIQGDDSMFFNFHYKPNLGDHYSINLAKINLVKDSSISISINSIYFYQLILQNLEFESVNSNPQASSKFSSGFFSLGLQKVLCRKILQISWLENYNTPLLKNFEIIFQEPIIFYSSQKFQKAIQIEVQNGLIICLKQFNVILNQEQLDFFWTLINMIKDHNQQQQQSIEDESQINQQKFQIMKTKFSLYYNVSKTVNFDSENQNDQYLQFDFVDFFLQESSNESQIRNQKCNYKSLFEFRSSAIQGLDGQLQAIDITGYFGALKLKKFIPNFNFDGQQSSIQAYAQNSSNMQDLNLVIQIKEVKIKHEDYDNFYRMLAQFNQVFNKKKDNQLQQQQQNFFFSTKIDKIMINLYQTLTLHLYKLQYFFTINYQFILIRECVAKMMNQNHALLQNQLKQEMLFTLIMKQSEIKLMFADFKLNFMNFNFIELKNCIQKFINSVKLAAPQNDEPNKKDQQLVTIFKCIILDLLPTYNEEVILKKRGIAKIEYASKNYPSWTRSFIVINNLQIKKSQISVEELEVYFTNQNIDIFTDQLFEVKQPYQKIGQIQNIKFQNSRLNIQAIQVFSLGKQIIQDLFDHVQHIIKDFEKDNNPKNKELPKQIKQFQVVDQILEIDCEQINLLFLCGNFQIVAFHTNLIFGKQSLQLRMQTIQVQDLIQKSKFKYILNEEDVGQFDSDMSQLLQKSPILEIIACYSDDSLAIKLDLKPIRICLSGYQLQEIVRSFKEQTVQTQTQFDNDEDDDHFQIIQNTKNFSLQVELAPIQIIISYDSEGVEIESISKTFLKMSSFNNLILATNKVLQFYQNNQTSKQDFVHFLINQQISTFSIIFRAYNSLEITKAASVFTNGIISMLTKPFISNNGFLYGLVEGSYEFTCGVTSSILQLTALPASAINNLANYMGLGIISSPLAQLDDFCQKLYYKINPDRGIPDRFYKTEFLKIE